MEIKVKSKYENTVSFSVESMNKIVEQPEITHIKCECAETEATLTRSQLMCWWAGERNWKTSRNSKHKIKVLDITKL